MSVEDHGRIIRHMEAAGVGEEKVAKSSGKLVDFLPPFQGFDSQRMVEHCRTGVMK